MYIYMYDTKVREAKERYCKRIPAVQQRKATGIGI